MKIVNEDAIKPKRFCELRVGEVFSYNLNMQREYFMKVEMSGIVAEDDKYGAVNLGMGLVSWNIEPNKEVYPCGAELHVSTREL